MRISSYYTRLIYRITALEESLSKHEKYPTHHVLDPLLDELAENYFLLSKLSNYEINYPTFKSKINYENQE